MLLGLKIIGGTLVDGRGGPPVRAVAEEPATDEDLRAMRALLREALRSGAVGFTTGRTDNYRSASGAPTPACRA